MIAKIVIAANANLVILLVMSMVHLDSFKNTNDINSDEINKVKRKYHKKTCLSTYLSFIHHASDGRTIYNSMDLEISHIEYQWRTVTGIPQRIRKLIFLMKEARNSLAHLEPVDIKLLLNGLLDVGLIGPT